MINSLFWIFGSISGALGVALGAFGAHALRSRLDASRLETFETAVRYQMIHALALVASALAVQAPSPNLASAAGWLFTAGTLLFSGSLYLLVFTGKRAWGAVTPFGGVAFIAGWVCLALCVL